MDYLLLDLLITSYLIGSVYCISIALKPDNPFVFFGDVLELNCTITNSTTYNASHIWFIRGANQRIDKSYVEVIDETMAQLKLLITESDADYYYICNVQGKYEYHSGQDVRMDYKPGLVENSKCIIDNWSTMTCDWRLKPFKYLHNVDVDVKWFTSHRSGKCPKLLNKNACHWNSTEYNGERDYVLEITQIYNIPNMEREVITQNISVQAQVKPSPVVDLKYQLENKTCITLDWDHSYKDRLMYKILYQCKWLKEPVIYTHSQTICDLYYNTIYTFSVSVAPVNGGIWSDTQDIKVTTPTHIPSYGPVMINGSYTQTECVDGLKDVEIYYKHVPEIYHNGVLLQYKTLILSNSSEPPIEEMFSVDLYSVIYTIRCDGNYTVILSAVNHDGESINNSQILISSSTSHKENESMRLLVYIEKEDNESVTATWSNPDPNDYYYYYLFWCQTSDGVKCESDMEWIEVTGDKFTFPETVSAIDVKAKRYKFGLSVNNGSISSSMVDPSCVFQHWQIPMTAPSRVNIDKDNSKLVLQVSWELNMCNIQDMLYIQYHHIHYCITEEMDSPCSGEITKIKVDSSVNYYEISDLTAGIYRVWLQAESPGGTGPEGQASYQTLEDTSIGTGGYIGIIIVSLIVLIFAGIGLKLICKKCRGPEISIIMPIDKENKDVEKGDNKESESRRSSITSRQISEDSGTGSLMLSPDRDLSHPPFENLLGVQGVSVEQGLVHGHQHLDQKHLNEDHFTPGAILLNTTDDYKRLALEPGKNNFFNATSTASTRPENPFNHGQIQSNDQPAVNKIHQVDKVSADQSNNSDDTQNSTTSGSATDSTTSGSTIASSSSISSYSKVAVGSDWSAPPSVEFTGLSSGTVANSDSLSKLPGQVANAERGGSSKHPSTVSDWNVVMEKERHTKNPATVTGATSRKYNFSLQDKFTNFHVEPLWSDITEKTSDPNYTQVTFDDLVEGFSNSHVADSNDMSSSEDDEQDIEDTKETNGTFFPVLTQAPNINSKDYDDLKIFMSRLLETPEEGSKESCLGMENSTSRGGAEYDIQSTCASSVIGQRKINTNNVQPPPVVSDQSPWTTLNSGSNDSDHNASIYIPVPAMIQNANASATPTRGSNPDTDYTSMPSIMALSQNFQSRENFSNKSMFSPSVVPSESLKNSMVSSGSQPSPNYTSTPAILNLSKNPESLSNRMQCSPPVAPSECQRDSMVSSNLKPCPSNYISTPAIMNLPQEEGVMSIKPDVSHQDTTSGTTISYPDYISTQTVPNKSKIQDNSRTPPESIQTYSPTAGKSLMDVMSNNPQIPSYDQGRQDLKSTPESMEPSPAGRRSTVEPETSGSNNSDYISVDTMMNMSLEQDTKLRNQETPVETDGESLRNISRSGTSVSEKSDYISVEKAMSMINRDNVNTDCDIETCMTGNNSSSEGQTPGSNCDPTTYRGARENISGGSNNITGSLTDSCPTPLDYITQEQLNSMLKNTNEVSGIKDSDSSVLKELKEIFPQTNDSEPIDDPQRSRELYGHDSGIPQGRPSGYVTQDQLAAILNDLVIEEKSSPEHTKPQRSTEGFEEGDTDDTRDEAGQESGSVVDGVEGLSDGGYISLDYANSMNASHDSTEA